ncbi:MAG: phage recombination protein Bet [Gemmatimonadota bacterium]
MTTQNTTRRPAQDAEIRTRLPMPVEVGRHGVDIPKWRVLVDVVFPSAQSAEAVSMALDYCRARGLDVFKRPVHIVPMWSNKERRYVETIWPGISEIQTTAARTGAWAGMDAPEWGPEVTETFSGKVKIDGQWQDKSVTVAFPEWCAVTVYRMVGGVKCAFTEPVFWREAYSTSGGRDSRLPTDMWIKRPRGQLHKVAKAAALRAAFPEEAGDPTAEEMDGKVLDDGVVVVEAEPERPQPKPRNLSDVAKAKPKADTRPAARAAARDVDPETGEVHGGGFVDDAPPHEDDGENLSTNALPDGGLPVAEWDMPDEIADAIKDRKFRPWLEWFDRTLENLRPEVRREFLTSPACEPIKAAVISKGAALDNLRKVLNRYGIADFLDDLEK